MLNLRASTVSFPRARARSTGSWQLALGLAIAALLTLSSCRNRSETVEPGTAEVPADQVPADSQVATPGTATPVAPDAPPGTAPNAAPTTAPSVTTGTGSLPATLVKEWEPLSNVLGEFGAMTISPDQITWDSGQSSQYALVSSDGGYLLKLEPVPVFFDTANPYIKLIPQAEPNGEITEVEVAFYESEEKAQSDEYIMFGTYFVQ